MTERTEQDEQRARDLITLSNRALYVSLGVLRRYVNRGTRNHEHYDQKEAVRELIQVLVDEQQRRGHVKLGVVK